MKFADLRNILQQYPAFGELVIEVDRVSDVYRIGIFDVDEGDTVNVTEIDLKCLVMEFMVDSGGEIRSFEHNWGDISRQNKRFVAELVGLIGQRIEGIGEHVGMRWTKVKQKAQF